MRRGFLSPGDFRKPGRFWRKNEVAKRPDAEWGATRLWTLTLLPAWMKAGLTKPQNPLQWGNAGGFTHFDPFEDTERWVSWQTPCGIRCFTHFDPFEEGWRSRDCLRCANKKRKQSND